MSAELTPCPACGASKERTIALETLALVAEMLLREEGLDDPDFTGTTREAKVEQWLTNAAKLFGESLRGKP